jgi:hypothetical protein
MHLKENMMTNPVPRYASLPVRPQLIRDAQLLTFFLEPDPHIVAALVPFPLAPLHDGRMILNMWSHSDPTGTTGFGGIGPMSVSYLAVEVAGEEGATADESMRFPGRLWLHHWSSLEQARNYAAAASGLDIMPGKTTIRTEGDRMLAELSIAGRKVISAAARVGHEKRRTVTGNSIYYAQRAAGEGGMEVAQFDIPWISDVFDANMPDVKFSFPDGAAPALLSVPQLPRVLGVTLRTITLVPYLVRRVMS